MAHFILHHEGAYNVWSTIVDAPLYESALTLDQLKQVEPTTDARLERAHKNGCSAIYGATLDECISVNRAGPQEARLSRDEFIAKFLTLPAGVKAAPAVDMERLREAVEFLASTGDGDLSAAIQAAINALTAGVKENGNG